jgi:hypothetical protein
VILVSSFTAGDSTVYGLVLCHDLMLVIVQVMIWFLCSVVIHVTIQAVL